MNIIVEKNLQFDSNTSAMTYGSTILVNKNFVVNEFVQSLLEREKKYPTGIEAIVNFALCHTEAKYVNEDCVYLLHLEEPVEFGDMVEPETTVKVSYIFILALKDPQLHLKVLQEIIQFVNDQKSLNNFNELNESDSKNYLKENIFKI